MAPIVQHLGTNPEEKLNQVWQNADNGMIMLFFLKAKTTLVLEHNYKIYDYYDIINSIKSLIVSLDLKPSIYFDITIDKVIKKINEKFKKLNINEKYESPYYYDENRVAKTDEKKLEKIQNKSKEDLILLNHKAADEMRKIIPIIKIVDLKLK